MIKLKDLIREQDWTQGKKCGNCTYFVKDREDCVLLTPPDVAYEGMCDLWEAGDPKPSDQVELRGMTPQAEANYTDDWRDHPWNRDMR